MKTKLLILFFILLTIKLNALTSPELHCIAVNNNGSITLTWTLPSDVNGFSSYHIFRSNIVSGPYQDIGNITNVNQTTYVDNSINANTQSYFYYVNCLSSTGVYTTPLDTLQSILLNVTNAGSGIANLVWNPIHIPALNTTWLYYYIYREKNTTGIWQLLDSTLSTQYNNAVNVCQDTLNYYVEIGDASGCISVSSIDGDLFVDQTAPVSIQFDTVSVDNTGNVILGWQSSPSVDTKGYYICRGTPGAPCTTLATVMGRFTTFYTDLTATSNTSSFSYRIAAFDSCGNTSIYSNNHNTIFLQSSLDICNDKIDLNWNSYINLDPQLLGYRVMLSINGGVYNSIATLTPGDMSYTYTGLTDSTKYCFFIQAYDSSNYKSSSSNIICYYTILAHNPSFLYIRHVSVVNNSIEIKVYTDTSIQINGYKVLRSEALAGPFSQIMILPYNALQNFIAIDNAVDVMHTVYYYKIVVINSCGADGLTSNTAHNILLTTKTIDNFTNELTWNEYGDWAGGVQSYDVFRSTDGGSSFNLIKNINAVGLPYIYPDDVSNYTTENGTFSYYVKAKENPNFTYPFTEESNSNVSALEQSPYIYIPNAFCPQGLNKEFKPVTGFISEQNYLMQIYNRYGQLIFETNNPAISWDGRQKGEYVPSGVYVYLIRYVLPNNGIMERTGRVTVVD